MVSPRSWIQAGLRTVSRGNGSANSPFHDYLIPGIVLLTVNGIGNLLAAVASFRRVKRVGEIAVALGVFLLVWMAAQVSWIGLFNWMQPLFFVFGITEVTLGFLLRKSLKVIRD